jgi:RNase P subunit RPR2
MSRPLKKSKKPETQKVRAKRLFATSKKSTHDDYEQSRLFIEKAREIGADASSSAADELIGQLAKKKPKPRS